jgi:hypothetical protein
MIVNKVFLNSEVEDMMKGFKANTQIKELARGGSKAITSIKANDWYKESKARIASTIAPNSNPRAQLSVLVDNGAIPDPEFYETESEKQQKLEEIIAQEQAIKRSVGKDLTEADIDAIELRLIKLSSQDGIVNPVLTKKQQELAIQTVEQTVDMSVETLVDYNAPESYNYNPKEDTPKEVWYGDYEKAYNAVMDGKLSVLNNMTGGKFNIEYESGKGYTVRNPNGKVVGNTDKIPIKNVDGLQEYLGISSLQNWTKQKEAFEAAQGGNASNPTVVAGKADSIFK